MLRYHVETQDGRRTIHAHTCDTIEEAQEKARAILNAGLWCRIRPALNTQAEAEQ